MVALQGHAGTLSDCAVCHGTTPDEPGPHGVIATDVVETELLGLARPMRVQPNPMRSSATIEFAGTAPSDGKLLIFDARGRTLRLLRPVASGDGKLRAEWDRRGRDGLRVAPGVYFIRWNAGSESAAVKVLVLD